MPRKKPDDLQAYMDRLELQQQRRELPRAQRLTLCLAASALPLGGLVALAVAAWWPLLAGLCLFTFVAMLAGGIWG